jgi:zinc protease
MRKLHRLSTAGMLTLAGPWTYALAGAVALAGVLACGRPQLLSPPEPVLSQTKSGSGPAVRPAVRPEPVPPALPEPQQAWQSLPSGARVLLLPDQLVGTVAVQLWVAAGVAWEPAGSLGLSHLTERLLLHELARGPSDKVRAAGGEVSSFTTLDHTVFHVLLPKGRQELALELLAALVAAEPVPVLDEPMLQRQRDQALLEQRQAQLSTRSLAVEKLRELSYPGHPYGRPLLGSRDELLAVRVPDIVAFQAHFYRPDRLTVVAAGALTESLTLPLRSLLSGLPTRDRSPEPAPTEPSRNRQPQVSVMSHDDPSGQAVVAVALPGVAASAADVAAIDLWTQLLRGGRGLRSLHRPGSEVSALSFACRQPGLVILQAAVGPGQLEEATQKLLSELFRPLSREIEQSELARAKQRLLGETALQRDTPSGRARRAGFFASLGIDEDRYDLAVREVSEAALRKTMARYLRRDSLAALWLLPRSRSPREETAHLERSRVRLLAQLQQSLPIADQPSKTPERSANGVWRYQVPGGPLLLVVTDHTVKVVGAAASWPGGLSLEDEQTAGSHALLQRLWREAPRGRGGPWSEAMSQLSGRVFTQLDLDGFTVVGEWPSLAANEALPLFLDGLTLPDPPEPELERERRQLLADSRQREEGLGPSLRMLKQQLFGRHPYQLEPSVQSLSGLSRKRLIELLRRAYTPAQLTLAIVGDVEPYTVLSLVESRLQGTARPQPLHTPSPPPGETPRQYLSYHARAEAQLALGFRIPGLGATDRAAISLLHEVLLGPGGRLLRELCERRGILLSLESRLLRGRLGGALLLLATTTPASLDGAEASLRDELRRIIDHPLGPDELEAARQRLLGRTAEQKQRRGDVALTLARTTALGLPSDDEDEQLLQSLTAAQVQAVARRYLDEHHAVLQAVLPQSLLTVKHGDVAEVKPKLLAKLTSPRQSKTQPPPTKLHAKPQPGKKHGSANRVGKQRSRR